MRTCHKLTIGPYHRNIHTALDQTTTAAWRQSPTTVYINSSRASGPLARWSNGELQILGYRDQEVLLDGRGLLLIPAYFCIRAPITLFDQILPPVLSLESRIWQGRLALQADLYPGVLPGSLLRA